MTKFVETKGGGIVDVSGCAIDIWNESEKEVVKAHSMIGRIIEVAVLFEGTLDECQEYMQWLKALLGACSFGTDYSIDGTIEQAP